MYWRLGFGANKEIDQILDKDNVELEELLLDDSIVHESKSHNYRLVEFLIVPQNLRKLLSYANGKISVDDERNKLRFPYVATEILSSDIPQIHDTLVHEDNREEYLQPFWDYIVNKPTEDLNQLNPFVGYWGRIIARLLDSKSDDMLAFLKSQPDPIESFLRHIETPVIGDLLFRLIASDHHNSTVIDFFTQWQFIPKLSNILSPNYSKDHHLAVSELLKTVITFSAPSPPTANGDNQIYISNKFARQLGSHEVVTKLIQFILDDVPIEGGSEEGDVSTNHLLNSSDNDKHALVTSSLISILSVYIELIRKNNTDFSEPHLFHTLRNKLITLQQSQHEEAINKVANNDDDDDTNDMNLNDEELSKKEEEEEEKEQSDKEALEGAMDDMSQSMGIVHLGSILKAFTSRLGDFQRLLAHPRSYRGMILSSTGPIKPLTFERFRICELYAELLHCSNMAIFNRNVANGPHYDDYGRLVGGLDALTQLARALSDSEETEETAEEAREADEIPVEANAQPNRQSLDTAQGIPQSLSNLSQQSTHPLNTGDQLKKSMIDNGILDTLTTLFFEYPSNPFLHNVVYDVILQILNGQMERGLNVELAASLFTDAKLISKLLDGHTKVKESQDDKKTPTPGYSGHIMLIADECVKAFDRYESLYQRVKPSLPLEDWQKFVQGPLKANQDIEKEPLGGIRPDSNPFGQYGKVEGDQDDSDSDDDIGFMSSGFGSNYRSLSGQSHANINFDEDDDDDDSFFSSFSFKGANVGAFGQSLDEDDMDGDGRGSSAQFGGFANADDDDDFGDFAVGGGAGEDGFGVSQASEENPFGDNFAPAAAQNLTPADWTREFKESVDNEGADGDVGADAAATITIPDLDEQGEEPEQPEQAEAEAEHTKKINDAIKGLKIGSAVDERASSSQHLDTQAPLGPGSNGAAEVTDESVKREVDGAVVEAPKDDMVLLAEEASRKQEQ